MATGDDLRARAREAFEAAFPGWTADVERGSQLAEERRASFEAGFIVGNGHGIGVAVAMRSTAPVAGDRLLASLACHIDHDEPPGLAARRLATELLGLVDGLTSFQVVMLSAHVRELAAKFKPGQPGEWSST